MSRSLSLVGLLLVAVAALASRPAVVVDRDPAVNLGAYRTFAFAGDDHSDYSTLTSQHLKQATRAELERRGYVYDERAPQLSIHLLLNVQQRQELRSSPSSPGFIGPLGYRIGGGYDLSTVTYKAGTLRVDLVDTERNALVWQGVVEGTIGNKAQKNQAAAIDRVVAEMFADFPGSAR
jgi:hypothetical protein